MKLRFSDTLFIRSYAGLAAAILIIALTLDSLVNWVLDDDTDPPLTVNEVGLTYTAAELGQRMTVVGADQQNIAARFNDAAAAGMQSLLDAPLELLRYSDFAGHDDLLDELQAGEIVSVLDAGAGIFLYKRVPDSDYILALGPLPDDGKERVPLETLAMISYYALVAIFLYLWIRPFNRDLGSLRIAASRFGRDDFSTRVSVGEHSSIRPVADSFNKMAERIQYLVTAHRDLTNAVAHELRTPLARFKFSMEILNKTTDPQKKADYLASMKKDVQELEELIDEMLTYAKLSEENLQLGKSTLPIDTWLARQIAQYPPEPIPIACHFEAPDTTASTQVAFNPDMLSRALHNILRNCLRYASTGIGVTLTLSPTQVTLRIADDGPGIPAGQRAAVFEPFARLDTSRDRQSGGYGLGLAIAKRILQRHGGSIHVEDNVPTGACFVLQWPRGA